MNSRISPNAYDIYTLFLSFSNTCHIRAHDEPLNNQDEALLPQLSTRSQSHHSEPVCGARSAAALAGRPRRESATASFCARLTARHNTTLHHRDRRRRLRRRSSCQAGGPSELRSEGAMTRGPCCDPGAPPGPQRPYTHRHRSPGDGSGAGRFVTVAGGAATPAPLGDVSPASVGRGRRSTTDGREMINADNAGRCSEIAPAVNRTGGGDRFRNAKYRSPYMYTASSCIDRAT